VGASRSAASSDTRSSSWGVWVSSERKAGKDAGALCGRGRWACAPPRRRSAAPPRRDLSATPRTRTSAFEAVEDIAAPRVGEERGVQPVVRARAPALVLPRVPTTRGRVPRGRTSFSRRGSTRDRERPLPARAVGAQRRWRRCASSNHSTTDLRPAAGAVRDDGIRQAARHTPLLLAPGRSLRVGWERSGSWPTGWASSRGHPLRVRAPAGPRVSIRIGATRSAGTMPRSASRCRDRRRHRRSWGACDPARR